MADYIHPGDKSTAPALKGKPCNAVRRTDMLMRFDDGVIVLARLLRKKR